MSVETNPAVADRYDLYVVKEFKGKEEKPGKEWVRVGVAFAHASKNGFNIRITPNISVTGDLVALKHEAKDTHESQESS
jgi:hypothetical protein